MESGFEPQLNINIGALPPYEPVTFHQIAEMSAGLDKMMDELRKVEWMPVSQKSPLIFNQAQLADLCNLSPDALARRVAKADELGLPPGRPIREVDPSFKTEGKGEKATDRRVWTLAEARLWIARHLKPYKRLPGQKACVITTALFKGGVAKTVTSVSLAQALSLRGYRKTLIIDLDPQGSASSLMGLTEVTDGMTVLPVFSAPVTEAEIENARALERAEAEAEVREYKDPYPPGSPENPRSTIKESIRPTYWDGVDIVAANRAIFGGDFSLPARTMRREPGFKVWDVLRRSLDDGTLDEYDFVVIDTPPALSYTVMNALWAADGLLMPLPPEGLDFASSTQYWRMFIELSGRLPESDRKSFRWIRVLPTKVDPGKAASGPLLRVMRMAYLDKMLGTVVPIPMAVSVTSTTQTVYEFTRYVGDHATYRRARQAFDEVAKTIEELAVDTCWTKKTG